MKKECFELGFEVREGGEIPQAGRQQIPDSLGNETERTVANRFEIAFRDFQEEFLIAELQRRIQAMEMRCYHKILRISYKDLVINKKVLAKVQQAIRPHKDLLTIVKRCKLQWYGLFSSDLAKTILQGTVKGTDLAKTILHSTVKGGKKTRQMEEEMGRQHQGMDTPGVRQVPEGSEELRKMEELVVKASVVPRRPSRLRDR